MFYSPHPATQAFRAGGLIPPSGEIRPKVRREVHRLMTKLEARVDRSDTIWDSHLIVETAPDRALVASLEIDLPEPAAGQTPPWRVDVNPFVPSGYTYLLQLAAHDLVDSVRFATIETPAPLPDGTARPPTLTPLLANARLRPLMLDTVYGAGPAETPLCYEADDSSATQPRTRLRTFRLNKPQTFPEGAVVKYCPYADIMRGSRPVPPPPVTPDRFPVYDQTDQGSTNRTEAFVADPRNDDHSIISQLLVVFHRMHNEIMDALRSAGPAVSEDHANRRFLCARFVMALIYRHVLKNDVLNRVLDPDVYEAYMTNTRARLPLDRSLGIPMEFTIGAFRFGHAMVREEYLTNAFRPGTRRFSRAREISASRKGAQQGLPDFNWVIDWSLFFGPNPNVNLSHRLGPHYSTGLITEPPKGQQIVFGELRDAGLGARDFLSAAYAGMWSVRPLFDVLNKRLEEEGLGSIKPAPYDDWRQSMTVWLKDYNEGASRPQHMTEDDIRRVADDPPLPFFVMFEAAHELDSNGRPKKAMQTDSGVPVVPGKGGRHLGRFGSILVADTIFGALHTQYFGFDEFRPLGQDDNWLSKGIRQICSGVLQDECALDALFAGRPMDRMQDVLAFLQSRGVFNEPVS